MTAETSDDLIAAMARHRARERRSPAEGGRSLFGLDGRGAMTDAIVWDLRLPVALMALTVGAALGAGGAQMQFCSATPWPAPIRSAWPPPVSAPR